MVKTKLAMCYETNREPTSCGIRKKSWREVVFDVDIVQYALTVVSFLSRLVNLNTPSAVV